ncbi:anti-sigma factor [Paenibacillus sp. DMB20]|uniref:anti-sigma factor n=1 Tax=Paenibacillus sp. DMB20 TaxID=1642570 RepID=UPI00062817BF|nr:anti-sigma factor [Paenibacillus sp. DMB20]KKO51943.1 anti-sigma factor [Paenibacillus sp. DMB20]
MNCEEAQELMERVWNLPDNDPKHVSLKQHIETCPSCAMEYEMWEDSMNMVHELRVDPPDVRAEAINRNVMDRIYRDFPWLVEENEKGRAVGRMFRKRLILWISGFAALFGSSFLYFAVRGNTKGTQPEAPATGILPTGVAGNGQAATDGLHYNIPQPGSGIIDPLVVGMDPSQPQYWMVLSVLGVGLALLFLMRLNKASRRFK